MAENLINLEYLENNGISNNYISNFETSFIANQYIANNVFTLEDLYKLGLKFFKNKDGNIALSINYTDRFHLIALTKQVKYGKYKPDKISDFVGNDRRQVWQALGDMTSDDAMKEFLQLLQRLCPQFVAYIQTHKVNKENPGSDKAILDCTNYQTNPEELNNLEEEIAQKQYQSLLKNEEKRIKLLKLEKQIRTALNQQTAVQYKQYAKQQHPDNEEEQEALIIQLQEQYFQHYIQQVHNQQILHQRQQFYQLQTFLKSQLESENSANEYNTSENRTLVDDSSLLDNKLQVEYFNEMAISKEKIVKASSTNLNSGNVESLSGVELEIDKKKQEEYYESSDSEQEKENYDKEDRRHCVKKYEQNNNGHKADVETDEDEAGDEEDHLNNDSTKKKHKKNRKLRNHAAYRDIDTRDMVEYSGIGQQKELLDNADNDEKDEEDYNDDDDSESEDIIGLPPLIPASIWLRNDIKDFKNSLKKSPDNIIKIGSLSTATIRVPTHDNGTSIFWEFSTDNYDIGFGVYFEWTLTPPSQVSVQISESSEEEGEEDESEQVSNRSGDVEKGSASCKKDTGPPMDEIIQVFRRDCHEEVYCGSHNYPGRGIYHLKFDNSYSLWRSKTVYYKVFYSR